MNNLSLETRYGLLTVATTVLVSIVVGAASSLLNLGLGSSAVPIGSAVALFLFGPKLVAARRSAKFGDSRAESEKSGAQTKSSREGFIDSETWDALYSRMQVHTYLSMIFVIMIIVHMIITNDGVALLPLAAFLVTFLRLYNLFEEINRR